MNGAGSTRGSVAYFVLLLLFSLLIVGYRLSLCFNYIGFEGFLEQDYPKPFVTRVLPIWLALLVRAVVRIDPAVIFTAMDVLAFGLAGWTFSAYLRTFVRDLALARVLSFTLYFVIPFQLVLPRYQPLYYPFDSLGLLFFTLGLLLLRKQKYVLYYALFIVATFNRETTCFLTMVMLLVEWRRSSRRTALLHTLAQAVLWVGIKILLAALFSDHPGVVFQRQYLQNILFVTDMSHEQRFPIQFEPFFRAAYLVGNFGFLLPFIALTWRRLANRFLRRSVLVMIPFYASMLYVANIFEYRIFGEVIPLVLAPCLFLVVKMTRAARGELLDEEAVP